MKNTYSSTSVLAKQPFKISKQFSLLSNVRELNISMFDALKKIANKQISRSKCYLVGHDEAQGQLMQKVAV